MPAMPPKPRAGGKRKPTKQQSVGGLDRRMLAMGLAGIVVVLGLGGLYFLGGEGDAIAADEVRTALEAADCRLRESEALPGNQHTVAPDGTSEAWTTDPPTSGPHSPETAIYGAYTEPLEQARLVHNLEHGAVFIQYGEDVPDAVVEELRSFYDGHVAGTLLAPYPTLADEIALGAWTVAGGDATAYLATCTSFDEAAFEAFFDEFQFKGPERFSPDSMLPGRP